MDSLVAQFAVLFRVHQNLDEKMSETGGMENLMSLHNKLRQSLEAISTG